MAAGILERLRTALRDNYDIERELGAGGMATVFLARDLKHQRQVAIKVVRPEIAAAFGEERFLREVAISAHLLHPNILTLIDSGTADGLLYCVMPFVQGETLRAKLAREGALPAADAVRILRDVLDALAAAHQVGIVHRDIKPDNLMLTGRHAFVMDFGIAKAATAAAAGAGVPHATLTTLGLAIGTPAYMAPEQASGEREIDGRADLYAVGVVGYEMLAGAPPFDGPSARAILAAQVTRDPESLAARRPDIPPELARAVMRCLAKEPAERWQTAEALLSQLERFNTPGGGTTVTPSVPRPRRRLPIVAVGILALILGAWWWTGPRRTAQTRAWVHNEAIPQLTALADAGDWEAAYTLGRRVEAELPGDSLFNALLPRFATRYRIHTSPAGAEVWRKAYEAPDSSWVRLGRTPLDSVLVALSGPGGTFLDANRIRIAAPGYRTMELIGLPFEDSTIVLDRETAIPAEMVRVGGGALTVQYAGFESAEPLRLDDFLMDRFEVTNRDYKRFVDSGGYRRREFWTEPMAKDGRPVPWAQAVARMTDRTGRTGPSTWEGGGYPDGTENDPVGGVSWYEAMAYARFAGKSLATVIHWARAASLRNSAWIVPPSNFSGQGAVAVGATHDISAFGTYDMAGNVREWCLNANGSDRFILGGGWDDPPYRFNDSYAQAPFDRSALNGIRLVRYPASDTNLARAGAPISRRLRDLAHLKPVSDPVFAAYLQMYEYDHTPLNARVIETVDEGEWTRELVRLDAAYGGDSLLTYLYLPKRGASPFPTVVFFPPGSAIVFPTLPTSDARHFDFLIKSGRAVLYPVYKGTYQRHDSLASDTQDSSTFYRDHVVMWGKDLRRAIDYLETRPEVSTARLAYYGVSWGGEQGGLMPAIEPRIKVSVLQVAGLSFAPIRPDVDPVNYLPRIRIPTLMINGRYDFYFPIETSQIPMFRLLGTPADQKRHVIEEGSHFVPRVRLIQEMLAWLDKYQPLPQ